LEEKYPNLIAQAEAAEAHGGKNPQAQAIAERAKLAAIKAKIEVYETNLKEIGELFSEQYSIGAKIEELDRRKQMEDAEYRSLEAKLKNAVIDRDLNPEQMPNITVVQHPTEPIKSYDAKTQKIILGLAGGGMALGLGLAFLIELLFDRRVRRPMEIQTRLQLPLLLSIPFIRRKERGGFLLANESGQPRIGMGDETALALPGPERNAKASIENAVRKTGHFILPYSETIRDRIIFNFEINNLTHKPKLVAVTGLSEGAGASTVAAGLAKSFSEIPGMKVLLVDLSSYHPEDNPLFGEIPRHTLNGALHLARNTQFRESPQALYYASANARRDSTGLTTFSPVHLYELMPHLQASQYDYIIFDMPPVDQTSRTLTMAGLMDKVLLVLDAENTSRDGLMWGYSELVKGRADVSCIFNKTRSPVPGWLIGGEA
jgi:Mrp family chromosome partitioning ATPase